VASNLKVASGQISHVNIDAKMYGSLEGAGEDASVKRNQDAYGFEIIAT
jgi:hypothetical protein